MTKALIDAMEHATPGTLFDGFAALRRALSRRRRARRHPRRAPARLDGAARRPAAALRARLATLADDVDARSSPRVAGTSARQLLEGFSWTVRGGERAPFEIPQELAARWNVRTARDR